VAYLEVYHQLIASKLTYVTP